MLRVDFYSKIGNSAYLCIRWAKNKRHHWTQFFDKEVDLRPTFPIQPKILLCGSSLDFNSYTSCVLKSFSKILSELTYISSILIDQSSVKLTGNREPNILHIHLAREGHWQRKWRASSSSSTDLLPRQNSLNGRLILSAWLPITQWPLSMATVVEIVSQVKSQ